MDGGLHLVAWGDIREHKKESVREIMGTPSLHVCMFACACVHVCMCACVHVRMCVNVTKKLS